MTLAVRDFVVIAGLMAAFVGVPIALVVANIRALTRRLEIVEGRVTAIEKEKADKSSWAREVILARNRMDQVATQLTRLEAKADQNWGVAAAMHGLVEEIRKMRETTHA